MGLKRASSHVQLLGGQTNYFWNEREAALGYEWSRDLPQSLFGRSD
jgi:hypothetical protein